MNQQNKVSILFVVLTIGIVSLVIGFFYFNSKNNNPSENNANSRSIQGATNNQSDGFKGQKGEKVIAENGQIVISENNVNDGNTHYFNYFSEKQDKTIYFFVIKADDGTYRVAANACEVCYGAKKGFTQQGNIIRCENCGNTYRKNQIAKEKGGCNPGPITDNAQISNSNLIIYSTSLSLQKM